MCQRYRLLWLYVFSPDVDNRNFASNVAESCSLPGRDSPPSVLCMPWHVCNSRCCRPGSLVCGQLFQVSSLIFSSSSIISSTASGYSYGRFLVFLRMFYLLKIKQLLIWCPYVLQLASFSLAFIYLLNAHGVQRRSWMYVQNTRMKR